MRSKQSDKRGWPNPPEWGCFNSRLSSKICQIKFQLVSHAAAPEGSCRGAAGHLWPGSKQAAPETEFLKCGIIMREPNLTHGSD